VDHGKTTLADNLIESNGIISERLAGTLRYMDSNEEEQRRGITMKSSAIALRHLYTPKEQSSVDPQQMVIHLIDSPGHVDFNSEVSSALLACDGAILVVDAVEGMCARTHSVLREAHSKQLVPLLVINKLDRLHTELALTPTDAYIRIRELIENVNAAAAGILITAKQQQSTQEEEQDENEEQQEEVWNFDPCKGNVIFCSALHGWGFTIPTLSRSLFRSKVFIPSVKPPQIRQVLFGDVRYNLQTQKLIKWRPQPHSAISTSTGDSNGNEPMFAQYALRPLWNIYENVSNAAAAAASSSTTIRKMTSITPGMDLVLSEIQIGSTTISSDGVPKSSAEMQGIFLKLGASSEESIIRAILRRYRPLSDAVLDSVCAVLPPPSKVKRTALTMKKNLIATSLNFGKLELAIKQCDATTGSPTVAHVCKFLTVKQCDISDPERTRPLSTATNNHPEELDDSKSNNNGDILVALVRVLSGTLQTTHGDSNVEFEVYGPKYDSSSPPLRVKSETLKLYLIMGATLIRVKSIPAGHICAVSNLSELQLKTLTLCDTAGGMPLQGFETLTRPLVKVNVEAARASDTNILERGLQRLSLADAAVEVTATSKGERILACQGELHLEKSILDLKKTYCEHEIELRISDPIADYGESTDFFDDETNTNYSQFFSSSTASSKRSQPLRQMTIPPYNEEEGLGNAKQGRCRVLLPERGAALRIRTLPLSKLVFQCLKQRKVVEGSVDDLKLLAYAIGFIATYESSSNDFIESDSFVSSLTSLICAFDGNGNCIIESSGVQSGACIKGVVSDEVHALDAASIRNQFSSLCIEDEDAQVNQTEEEEKKLEQASTTYAVAVNKYEALEQQIRCTPSVVATVPSKTEVLSQVEACDLAALKIYQSEIRGSIAAGFQLAMRSGPFCEEPVRGVIVVFEGAEIAIHRFGENNGAVITDTFAPAKILTGGTVVSAIRQGIRCSLLSRPARVAEAHLRLTLHTSLAGLGPLYAVLSKRRGKVISDTMVEGTNLILITANLPQSESFGLSQELLKQSSGEVTAPELVFSHFEVLKEDPFWAPTSEEEIEEFGDRTGDNMSAGVVSNKALSIVRDVRKRKGLLVDSSKIVVAAEKQRTLSKKK